MSQHPSNLDIQFMREALTLAASARGDVEPNPMVGCILHREGRIIAKGWHRRFGGPHAEPDALSNCAEDPRGASAVVTLEPCCHTNKKTPPCVPALLSAGITRVVIGQIDPNPEVSGRGADQLRRAGVEVLTGILERECQQLNAAFHSLTKLGRPFVTLKWAQSADGLMGGSGNTPRQISGPQSSRLVHMLRTRCDAIMVSADTVITDDPMLTVRSVPFKRTPARVILDTHLRTPSTSRVVRSAGEIPTHIFTCAPHVNRLGDANVHKVDSVAGHVDLNAVLRTLGDMKHSHLLIEAGPRLANMLLSAGLIDRLWVIRSPKVIGEPNAPRAPEVTWPAVGTRQLGEDLLSEHLNPESPCYFANRSSPEFSLPLE